METCRNIRKKLSAYQDRELGPADKDAIEAHLRACEACRKKHEALLQTYRMLRRLPEIEPAPGLSRMIVDRTTGVKEVFWVRALGQTLRWLPASAAIAAMTVAGLLAGTMLGNFLTERQFRSSQTFSAFHSGQTITLASVRVFDATPPGSFAGGYLKLASRNLNPN